MFKHKSANLTTLLLLMLLLSAISRPTRAQETTRTFPETGKTVSGIFLQYWNTHGSLAQQGYPISDELDLQSTDGKTYKTQFFERAVFEQHPEFAGTDNEVLLKLVGQTFYGRHFGSNPPPNQTVNPENTLTFPETGRSIGGKFRTYWEQHGGLAQQGYPMTDEFTMTSTDGKQYTTQVFQRGVFELHPEFAGTENEVLLRLLGVEEWAELNKPKPTITPSVSPTNTPVFARTPTSPPNNEGLKTVGRDYLYTFSRARRDNGQQETITVRIDNKDADDPRNPNDAPEIISNVVINSVFSSDFKELMTRLLPDGRTNPTLLVSGYFGNVDPWEEGFEEIFRMPENENAKIYWRMKENNNAELAFLNKDAWQNLPITPQSKFQLSGVILHTFIYAITSRTSEPISPPELATYLGRDETALRLAYELGYKVNGYPDDHNRELMFSTILPPHP